MLFPYLVVTLSKRLNMFYKSQLTFQFVTSEIIVRKNEWNGDTVCTDLEFSHPSIFSHYICVRST